MKTEYCLPLGSDYLNRQLPFLFQKTPTQHRKNEVSEMIENKNDASRNLEKALQALEQAKQRVANEKKKQNEKKRKAENHISISWAVLS
ncbi:hypothetical protein IMSAGC011_03304 [Lachnospiraceae bacterium]|nr:hypothetical protein IMSAGC011_03304 [Lachnospiraceae bacterium]